MARKTSAKTSCDGAGNSKSSCKGAGGKRGVEEAPGSGVTSCASKFTVDKRTEAWRSAEPVATKTSAKSSCKGAGEKRGVEEALGGGTSFASTFTAGLSTITVRPLEEDRGVRSAEPVARKTSAKTSCKGAGEKIGVEEALGGGTGREESSGEEAFGGAIRREQRRAPGRTYGP